MTLTHLLQFAIGPAFGRKSVTPFIAENSFLGTKHTFKRREEGKHNTRRLLPHLRKLKFRVAAAAALTSCRAEQSKDTRDKN